MRDPDVIIEFDMEREPGVHHENITPEWRYLNTISAVQKNQRFVIGGNYSMIPGPRLILLAEDLNEILRTVRVKEE